MKVKFINSYTLASYFVLGTFIIGVINIFIHGLEDLGEVILAVVILLLRYFSFILVKRSFSWSKYLLIILLARSIYRLWYICTLPGTDFVGIFLMILQIIFTILALSLITKVPSNLYHKRIRK